AAVGLPGGAPPQAALVLGVGPEVVEELPALDDGGDLVGGVQHLEDLRAHPLETLGAQRGGGVLVVLARPGERCLVLDLLEPGVRVGGRRVGGRSRHPALPSRSGAGSGSGAGARPGAGAGSAGGAGSGAGARPGGPWDDGRMAYPPEPWHLRGRLL